MVAPAVRPKKKWLKKSKPTLYIAQTNILSFAMSNICCYILNLLSNTLTHTTDISNKLKLNVYHSELLHVSSHSLTPNLWLRSCEYRWPSRQTVSLSLWDVPIYICKQAVHFGFPYITVGSWHHGTISKNMSLCVGLQWCFDMTYVCITWRNFQESEFVW